MRLSLDSDLLERLMVEVDPVEFRGLRLAQQLAALEKYFLAQQARDERRGETESAVSSSS